MPERQEGTATLWQGSSPTPRWHLRPSPLQLISPRTGAAGEAWRAPRSSPGTAKPRGATKQTHRAQGLPAGVPRTAGPAPEPGGSAGPGGSPGHAALRRRAALKAGTAPGQRGPPGPSGDGSSPPADSCQRPAGIRLRTGSGTATATPPNRAGGRARAGHPAA